MRPENERVTLAVKAFVFNEEGKLLTLLRTETAPTRPCTWDLPGGGYERGEDPSEAVRREIREEAGLEVTDLSILALKAATNSNGDQWVRAAYKARAKNTSVTLSSEHSEYRWVTISEFLELETAEGWKDIAREYLLD